LIEVSPAKRRGTVAGLYNTLFFLGSILATFSVLLTQPIFEQNMRWRFPVLMQALLPSVVALGVSYIPESPRWLISKGYLVEARDIMAMLHADGILTPAVMDEVTKIELEVKQNVDIQPGWSVLYSSPSRKRRLFILLCMSLFGQFSGNNVITYYLPDLLNSIGVTDMTTKLCLNAAYAGVGWVAAAYGARLHDIYGRRKILYTCTSAVACCMGLLSGFMSMYEYTSSTIYSVLALVAIYGFGIIFAMGYSSMQPVYPGEVMKNDMRARGMAIATMFGGTGGVLTTLVAPAAMMAFGPLVFAWFSLWDFFEAAIIRAFFVETKGKTLEELEEIFQSEDPVAASLSKQRRNDRFSPD